MNWLQNLSQSMGVWLKLIISYFGSLTFKTLQFDFVALSSSFFFLHMQPHIHHHPFHSSFSMLSWILFFRSLEWFQFTSDFVYRNVLPPHCITIFVSPLFYFFETNIVTFQHYNIFYPWFFKSIISLKHFSINSYCLINSVNFASWKNYLVFFYS